MQKPIWKYFTYAIYFDTNALISAGRFLNSQWINELLSVTNKFKVNVYISELVLSEWCEHILNELQNSRQSLLSQINYLKHFGISIPEIKPDEILIPEKSKLFKILSLKLKNFGFQIIQNWDAPLSVLLSEAVSKIPPFESKGKGLCDAVILESYIKHAKENFPESKVLVVSNDKAVKRSGERFSKYGIAVDFSDHLDIVEKLKSVLNDEIAGYIKIKKEKLKEDIKAYEEEIFDFIKKSPIPISDFMLHVMKRDKEERLDGVIEKILSIKPIEIIDAIGGIPIYGKLISKDRFPIMILIEIELTVVIRKYESNDLYQTRAVVQPNAIDPNSPIILKDNFCREPQEIVRTIKRYMPVFATIDAEKEKDDAFEDFQIEKNLTE